MSDAVETHELTKRFPEPRGYLELLRHPFATKQITALDGVSLRIREGELFGVLGPNGAGKTTLIKILCTLILPTSGHARVNGLDVTKDGAGIRRSVGLVVSDERSFYWRLTGRQNLMFFAALNNLTRRRAKAAIAEVAALMGLEEFVDRSFKDYSAGMRQRLAVARGLLTRPAIICFDEPTRNLDPVAAATLRRFIRDRLIREAGKTVLLATNNMSEAEALCDRVAVIHRGRVRLCGRVEAIRAELAGESAYALRLRGETALIEALLRSLELGDRLVGFGPDPDGSGAVLLRLRMNGDRGEISAILRRAVAAGVDVCECVRERTPLDELFARVLE